MVVCPTPTIDEWWKTKGSKSNMKCILYLNPPSLSTDGHGKLHTLGKQEWMQALDVEVSDSHASIQVFHKATNQTGWANVWKFKQELNGGRLGIMIAFPDGSRI